MAWAQSSETCDAVRGRITVSARMRPLLESEINQGVITAPWALTEKSIALRDGVVGRRADGREADTASKTRSELRTLDHLKRDDGETIMDAVFDGEATTIEVYERSFRDIVAGTSEGLNGAIIAYGQTSSGKTYSISGTSATPSRGLDDESSSGLPVQKGIIHFALDDLFSQIHAKTAAKASEGGAREYLVRMSYCELYMERVNDLLRKISPQSQNLPVKEDAESRSFYVEGIKEKIVSSPEEVHSLLMQAEKRRRVAYTRYNEVSSRSHTLLTLYIECSMPLEATNGTPIDDCDDAETRVTKVGRLTIVDLAGNERMEAGTEYIAESTSINKSLFFLGKVIEKLSGKERDADGGEHVPFRDSKLTRLLSVHLGGNSQTGMLVTLTPQEEFVEQSLTTLRFAQKASTIKCTAKPVLISKEQSLIMKQREIISQLHQQVRELKEAQQRQEQAPVGAVAVVASGSEADVSVERQQRVEQLQALTLGPGTPSQAFVSKSREVDAIVTSLHRNNDVLRKQKATVLEEFKDLHRVVAELARETSQMAAELKSGSSVHAVLQDHLQPNTAEKSDSSRPSRAWEPAVQDLYLQLRLLLQATHDQLAKAVRKDGVASAPFSPQSRSPKSSPRNSQDNEKARRVGADIKSASTVHEAKLRDAERQLREENSRLRASMKHLFADRERLKAEVEEFHNASLQSVSEPPCKRSDGTGGTGSAKQIRSRSKEFDQLRSPSRSSEATPKSSVACARPSTAQSDVYERDFESTSTSAPSTHRSSTQDWEPIIERKDKEELLRSSGRLPNRLDIALGEFDIEPIVERCTSASPSPPSSAPRPPTLGGGSRGSRSQPPPPKPPDNARITASGVSELAPRLTMDYFRQIGVRTSWKPGDTAYWRGQECRIVKVVGENQPLYVVLRTPSGSEVTTDLCLLSEAPPNNRAMALHPVTDAADNSKPLRLAPLGDLCLERPPTFDRSIPPERPCMDYTTKENGKPTDSNWSSASTVDIHDKGFGRASSLPARGLSPVRAPSRQSTTNRMRCMSPGSSLTSL